MKPKGYDSAQNITMTVNAKEQVRYCNYLGQPL